MTTGIVYFLTMRKGAAHPERHKPNSPEATWELPGLQRKAGCGGKEGSCQTAGLLVKEKEKKPKLQSVCLMPGDSALSFNQRLRDHRYHSPSPGNIVLLCREC